MPPKGEPKPKSKPKAKPKAQDPEGIEKKGFSNFKASLQYAADRGKQAHKELLDFYNSLDRFDKRKNDLVTTWKADKSLTWWTEFKESSVKKDSVTSGVVKGYGTKLDS